MAMGFIEAARTMGIGPFGKLAYIVPELNKRVEHTIRKRCADEPSIELASRAELANLGGWLNACLKR